MPSKIKKRGGKISLDNEFLFRDEKKDPRDVMYFLQNSDLDDLMETVKRIGKEGDTPVNLQAAKFILERCVHPPLSSRPIKINLPRTKAGKIKIRTIQDYEEALTVISGEMADGKISPDEANKLKDMLSAHKEAIFSRELIERADPIREALNLPKM